MYVVRVFLLSFVITKLILLSSRFVFIISTLSFFIRSGRMSQNIWDTLETSIPTVKRERYIMSVSYSSRNVLLFKYFSSSAQNESHPKCKKMKMKTILKPLCIQLLLYVGDILYWILEKWKKSAEFEDSSIRVFRLSSQFFELDFYSSLLYSLTLSLI